ncbi:MAG TPA: hypothetical protein VKR32_03345 [Puia sp.]|nr:hypothetical protein [Puia sp.]
MEVHHHPDFERKRFREYFFEFVMIFLAVAMGFFAESMRQHIEDGRKEREIVASLRQDLVKDTARLEKLITVYEPQYHDWVDSAHFCVDSLPLRGNERRICKALFNATVWATYTPPEIALAQLKSSGGLDLVSNAKVRLGILDYNIAINNFNKYTEFITIVEHSVDTSLTRLIPRQATRKFLEEISGVDGFLGDHDVPQQIIFKTYLKADFENFLNKLDQIDFKIHDLADSYKTILGQDIKLLKSLDEVYKID